MMAAMATARRDSSVVSLDRALAAADRGERMRPVVSLREGEAFVCPPGPDVPYVETGALVLDMVTMNGASLCLRRIEPGCAIVDPEPFITPAFTPCYHAERATRIGWIRARGGGRGAEAELMVRDARELLLGACLRLVHELACLQTPHRLYGELLRLAAAGGDGASLALPSHGQLALRLCTTRETVSRELSFLRRTGVLGDGKTPRLLNAGFLLTSLGRALGVASEREVWQSIGVDAR